MPIEQEFDVPLSRRRREHLISARTQTIHGRRYARARVRHRAVLEWQPLNVEAEGFGFACEDFQSRLFRADDARSADQRFKESEGGFSLRIEGSIECFGHFAHWSMIQTICRSKDGAKALAHAMNSAGSGLSRKFCFSRLASGSNLRATPSRGSCINTRHGRVSNSAWRPWSRK